MADGPAPDGPDRCVGDGAGDAAAGDPVEIISRPEHDVTVAAAANIVLFERDRIGELLVPGLAEHLRSWALAGDDAGSD